MKKKIKIIWVIFTTVLILAAMLIPVIYGSAFDIEDGDNKLDIQWYYETSNGAIEVDIPGKLNVKANETCTIFGYIESSQLSSQTILLRSSYQRVDIYIDDELIYSYDTDSYRPYGKANPSKIHSVLLPEDVVGKKISISITSPYSQYSGYFSNLEVGEYNTLIHDVYVKYNVELIFGVFAVLLSIFLLLSNVIVVRFREVSKSIYYIFGACVFLGSWMIFDSKLINLFMNEFLVNQFVYISLHVFAFMFACYVNTESSKYTKPITSCVIILALVNMITQGVLNLLSIYDYVEMLFISIALIFLEILLLFVNRIVRNVKKHIKSRQTKTDELELIMVIILLVVFVLDVYLLLNTFISINVILGIVFILIAIITHYKTIYQLSEEAQASQELKSRLSQTQNYLIQSQMKPHFIFNTLGAIRTMIKSSPDKAYQLITSFSKYLRANINTISPEETISFASEMDHIKTYVDIEKVRFGERLTVLYDIKCDNFNLPPLTVEPLVENAVKHGVCKKIKGGVVKISSWEEEDRYIVTVEDNGVGFDVVAQNDRKESTSVGIKYIKLRLKELSNADFEITSEIGVGTKATLIFFKNKEDS